MSTKPNLHDLQEAYYQSLEAEIGTWTGASKDKDGNWVFTSYQQEGKEQGTVVGVKSDKYPNTIIKTVIRPPMPGTTWI